MKTTPIQKMEKPTNIPQLCVRRECKAMLQANKYIHIQNHPMQTRIEKLSPGKLKRSSFAKNKNIGKNIQRKTSKKYKLLRHLKNQSHGKEHWKSSPSALQSQTFQLQRNTVTLVRRHLHQPSLMKSTHRKHGLGFSQTGLSLTLLNGEGLECTSSILMDHGKQRLSPLDCIALITGQKQRL